MPRELSPQVLQFLARRKPPRITLPWLCGSQIGKQCKTLQKPRSMHSEDSQMYDCKPPTRVPKLIKKLEPPRFLH